MKKILGILLGLFLVLGLFLMFMLFMFVGGCVNTLNTDTQSSIDKAVGAESAAVKSDGTRTFEFTDNAGKTFVLVLKPDETATWSIKGKDKVHYVSWMDFFGELQVSGLIGDKDMPIVWPANDEKGTDLGEAPLEDGYIYKSSSACRAKDPEHRLKLKEIH